MSNLSSKTGRTFIRRVIDRTGRKGSEGEASGCDSVKETKGKQRGRESMRVTVIAERITGAELPRHSCAPGRAAVRVFPLRPGVVLGGSRSVQSLGH
jgi:hypothetical protein